MQAATLTLLSQQDALQRAMDVVANNIANVNTTAYKRVGFDFGSVVSSASRGSEPLSLVVDRSSYRDASVGPIQPTGNQLDLAIQGSGYFEVMGTNGSIEYTRGGSFQINNQGQITTLSGLPVLSDGGQPITVPDTTTQINISTGGFITARVDNSNQLSELGKVAVVGFDNEQLLKSAGNGLYTTNQVASTDNVGKIVQGAVEQSNVQPISEMSKMIEISRAYERTTNLISQESTRVNDALTKLSKTTV